MTILDERIEQQLRDAFRAAAADVHPGIRPQPTAPARMISPRRPAVRGWLVPVIAAAAVVAVIVPLALVASRPDDALAPAAAMTVNADRAEVAGVSIPIPGQWTAAVVTSSDDAVVICLAVRPVEPCDGVLLHIAIPGADGSITPVPSPDLRAADPIPSPVPGAVASSMAASSLGVAAASMTDPDIAAICPLLIDSDPIGGRPAQHYSIGPCAGGGSRTAVYYVIDGSLAITTPRGGAEAEATMVAAGIDFSGYRHESGPQTAAATSAQASSSAYPEAGPTR